MHVTVNEDSFFIDQSEYAKKILVKFVYENAHAVGIRIRIFLCMLSATDLIIMYLATCTRPDLAYEHVNLSR